MIEEAKQRLALLEREAAQSNIALPTQQMSLFSPKDQNPILKALADISVNDLTPRQALETLYRLKELAEHKAD